MFFRFAEEERISFFSDGRPAAELEMAFNGNGNENENMAVGHGWGLCSGAFFSFVLASCKGGGVSGCGLPLVALLKFTHWPAALPLPRFDSPRGPFFVVFCCLPLIFHLVFFFYLVVRAPLSFRLTVPLGMYMCIYIDIYSALQIYFTLLYLAASN